MGRGKTSAGLLMYRYRNGEPEFFLAHPGGPFFSRKDLGHWTVPKGEPEEGEDWLCAAIREFQEEVGKEVEADEFIELGSIRQKGGKVVHVWGFEGNWDQGTQVRSSTFEVEWPPKSGRLQQFPEVDKAEFFPMEKARQKIKSTQEPLLHRLVKALNGKDGCGRVRRHNPHRNRY